MSSSIRLVVAAATASAALLLASPAFAAPLVGQRQAEEALTCQCGCGLTVASCNHLECGFAVPVRKEIAASLERGETVEQILERYKQEYGEKVLSSPVPEGFNILAWIAPYLAILLAGSVMFTFFRRRARVAAATPPAPATPVKDQPATDARIARLQNEVEDLQR